MSRDKNLSLDFYKYLCQKLGSEEDVRVRRLSWIVCDLSFPKSTRITSGSIGEGLDIKGSDLDVMVIDPSFKVYESDRDITYTVPIEVLPLVMDTENTHPCFTQLRLPLHFHYYSNLLDSRMKQMFEQDCLVNKLSNEKYKLDSSYILNRDSPQTEPLCTIHGPCLSDQYGTYDLAFCLKCDKWISSAQSWVSRPRTTWPSPELITKITSCGVLFVPIGCKGSSRENLEWRISFSVAEKCLIYSFSHTQLLCYALLKILLKEIVDNHEDLKGLLCSYFLKTLIFWISEESDPSIWKPENIIQCFMVCLKRLIYCVEYSTLLHYFIPDNNLLYMRFNCDLKHSLTNTLKNLYQQGINCFVNSETLKDFTSLNCEIPVPFTQQILTKSTLLGRKMTLKSLLYYMLHHCRTDLARRIFTFFLSPEHDELELQDSKFQPRSNNKHQYNEYKCNLCKLLIVLSLKTIPGWLMLASFFYVSKQYNTSIIIINHALKKHQDEEFYRNNIETSLIQNKDSVRTLLQKEKIPTLLKEHTLNYISLGRNCPFFPPEVKLKKQTNLIPTLPFAHFLHFLCYYHLHAYTSCKQSLQKIYDIYHDITFCTTKDKADKIPRPSVIHLTLYIGLGFLMIGDTITARKFLNFAARYDIHRMTDAAERLSSLS
ncbi:uncharacterized protein [Mytilus edulis]|uniref:uncharacterized protein n=1 Tax=Mytilus edulis TaxID=6550 RepID=UPI0039EE81BE